MPHLAGAARAALLPGKRRLGATPIRCVRTPRTLAGRLTPTAINHPQIDCAAFSRKATPQKRHPRCEAHLRQAQPLGPGAALLQRNALAGAAPSPRSALQASARETARAGGGPPTTQCSRRSGALAAKRVSGKRTCNRSGRGAALLQRNALARAAPSPRSTLQASARATARAGGGPPTAQCSRRSGALAAKRASGKRKRNRSGRGRPSYNAMFP